MVSSDFVGYFWLTLTAIGPTLGATGMAGTGMLGGLCCNGEALSRFGITGRWWTTCPLPSAAAMTRYAFG